MTPSFLRAHRAEIVRRWEELARERALPADREPPALALRDHLPELLDDLAGWLESDASRAATVRSAGCRHAIEHLDSRYGIAQVVVELGLLRGAIGRLLLEGQPAGAATAPAALASKVADAVDLVIAEAVEHFVVRDLAERKANEARLARSEAALAHAGTMAHLGAWWAEYDVGEELPRVRATWSDEAFRICGYEPGEVEVTGALFLQHVHPDDRARVQEAMAHILAEGGHPYTIEHRILRKDGGERRVVVHADARPTEDGRKIEMRGAVQDVTEQRQAEDALREVDRRKTEFLAVLSHELRNPLAPIRHSVELLERTPRGSEAAIRAQAVIRRQSEHLARLVDDLLDVTRIARGKIQVRREVADLRDVVRRACEDLGSVFEQSGVELRLDVPAAAVWVDVDVQRVAQVAGNLLGNANKFTLPGGSVTVVVRARGRHAELRVRDTGIGMDPRHVSQMFEPFVQEDRGVSRTRGGLGLGLALARGLVELHGGTIAARSEGQGKGSELLVRLPLARARRRVASRRVAPRPAPPPRLRVLVIDDNPDAARAVAELLSLDGHEVTVARDGQSGIAVARAGTPDVVLCDIGLPDVDGYSVVRTLRRDPALAATRIIALSGYAGAEDRRRSQEAGFDAHLAKPTPLDELEASLRGDRS